MLPRVFLSFSCYFAKRLKQIEYGKVTQGYANYVAKVPVAERKPKDPKHPTTPDPKDPTVSKRNFAMRVRSWRKLLHQYDDPVEGQDGGKQAAGKASPEHTQKKQRTVEPATAAETQQAATGETQQQQQQQQQQPAPTVADMAAAAAAGGVAGRQQLLGNYMYPRILAALQQTVGDAAAAGKITGMFLELEDAELADILSAAPGATQGLEAKVPEALAVLQAAAPAP